MSTVRTDTGTVAVRCNEGEIPNVLWREVTSCGIIEWQMEVIMSANDGTEFKLVDQVKCIDCGYRWFVPSEGKSSRVFNGLCVGEHRNASTKNVASSQSKELPKRSEGKA